MPPKKRAAKTSSATSNKKQQTMAPLANGDVSGEGWQDLPAALEKNGAVSQLDKLFTNDGQFQAFTTTDAITTPITFGIKSSDSDSTIVITATNGKGTAKSASSNDGTLFTLSAAPFQWANFFQPIPQAPYQSYWGMFGMNIKQSGIEVLGDSTAFAFSTHVWRRALELLRDAYNGAPMAEETDSQENLDEDHIVSRYFYIECPKPWGRCKIFVEESGDPNAQEIVFLHTAGSDSRQYHGVMNDPKMMGMCRMIAFDLPGHGRSFPSRTYYPGAHTNLEDTYVGTIVATCKKLGLKKPIICGASMAGQVSLACAVRAKEFSNGLTGTIPMQGSDYLNMDRQFNDRSPYVNQSLFNPEWIYGMMCPTSPEVNKRLIWHTYSAQAYGIFHGDLDFYFGGWDGRDRMSGIKCPVFMLTGAYDWSNTPAMSQATADKIPGAKHKAMEGLGHFPATENPAKFIPHLAEAVEWLKGQGGSK